MERVFIRGFLEIRRGDVPRERQWNISGVKREWRMGWGGVGMEEQVEKRVWEGITHTEELWKCHMNMYYCRISIKYTRARILRKNLGELTVKWRSTPSDTVA